MKKNVILVADDENTVREVIRKYLEKEGFAVLESASGPETLKQIYEGQPDLVILDIMLPGLDGYQIMRSLRSSDEESERKIPVIMLTARTQEDDRITGFEAGADDYVPKPFSPRELMMRVKAVLRRSGAGSGGDSPAPISEPESDELLEALEFPGLRLEPLTHSVFRGDESILLTAKEFELLLFMARNPRQVFNRMQLLDRVWGYEFYGDESTVTVHIHRLREKLEPDPTKPKYIHTVWGVGYKFEIV